MAGITLYKVTNGLGRDHFVGSCCNRDCTSITGGRLTFYANIEAAVDHYFYTFFRKPSRQLCLSLTHGAGDNPLARKHALDYPMDSIDEAAICHADAFGQACLLSLDVTNPSQTDCKQLKCAMAYQVTSSVRWGQAVDRPVKFSMQPQLPFMDVIDQHLPLTLLNNPDVEEPPTVQQPRRHDECIHRLPVVDCDADADVVKTLYVPFAAGALAQVIGQGKETGKVLEPSFFESMASFPGDSVIASGMSIPLFLDPAAALVQLKFQILAAHATRHVHDTVQWNAYSPGLDAFNFDGLALIEFAFKRSLWQKLHTLPILGKSKGCPIFHYKLAVPLPMEHPGCSWKVYRATITRQISNELSCSLQVHLGMINGQTWSCFLYDMFFISSDSS